MIPGEDAEERYQRKCFSELALTYIFKRTGKTIEPGRESKGELNKNDRHTKTRYT